MMVYARKLVALSLASSLFVAGTAYAAPTTTAAPAVAAAHSAAKKPKGMVMAKPMASMPMGTKSMVASAATPAAPAGKPVASAMMMAHAKAKPAMMNKSGAAPRMVQARLSNGKTVTYNCSLAGNQNKKACKG